MSKKKTSTEVEHLRGLVRELKSENKQLKKRLKTFERTKHNYEREHDAPEEETQQEDNGPVCTDCGKGVLVTVDLGIKSIITCGVCGERTIVNHR